MISTRHHGATLTGLAALLVVGLLTPAGVVAGVTEDDCAIGQEHRIVVAHALGEVAAAPAAHPMPAVASLNVAAPAGRAIESFELKLGKVERLEEILHGRVAEIELPLAALEEYGISLYALAMDLESSFELDVVHDLDISVDDFCLYENDADGPWSTAVDAIVDAARLPARAGLVARHIVEAFVKVIPRVVRAIA